MGRGQDQAEPVPSEVARLVDAGEARLKSLIETSGFSWRINMSDGVGATKVLADEDRFIQVLINLVDNAIKFTPADARQHVEMNVIGGPHDVTFAIRDFGRGVSRSEMKRIFELFYRDESELTRETVGTGIGLALVSELAGQMGGKIDVINREPGAEFRLTLHRA